MKRIDALFDVKYGNSLDLASLCQLERGDRHAVNFVSRTAKNNGLSAIVEQISDETPQPAGTISVAVSGSVMEAFLQPEPYYTGFHVMVLTPKTPMTDVQKLYYCACLRANKYRYNYGRQANKTLAKIQAPDLAELPDWVAAATVPDYGSLSAPLCADAVLLDTASWKAYSYSELFDIQRGDSVYLQDLQPGCYPYVSASSNNNGVSAYVDVVNRPGNAIVVNYDGSIGEAFYQAEPFFASEKVVTLTLLHGALDKYIAMFLIALIRQERFRFNYGLKWSVNLRMRKSSMRLPAKADGTPDWDYLARYVRSLSFSASI